MKFLMTLFQIQDYGGIINHAEYLALGMKELGHTVDFRVLVPRDKIVQRTSVPKDIHEYSTLGTGYKFHQARGWYGIPKVPYLSKYHRNIFKEKCSEYDAVLWHIPVPTMSKDNKDVYQWLDLYDNGTKNIAIIHDGNLPELYPHLLKVADQFHACACVHESAFISGDILPIPRKLILNPFQMKSYPDYLPFHRRNGFAAIQVFKAWKRVDTLIRAIPYMSTTESKMVGGEGIEYRYMTSKDKCKPKYFNSEGERIWDIALQCGMEHLGTVRNEVVLEHLRKVKLQIDPSYSKKYSSFGAHFNRTTVEAMIQGAVPMATDWGMKNSKIFTAGQNYIEIPAECPPSLFADIIDDGLTNQRQWEEIVENNYELCKLFDMKNVAQDYVSLVKSETEVQIGKPTPETVQKCNKNLHFFSVAPI